MAILETCLSLHLEPSSYQFILSDAQQAIHEAEGVDLISLIHVISVVPNPEKIIEEAIKKLNPGGELLIYISALSKKIPLPLQNHFKI